MQPKYINSNGNTIFCLPEGGPDLDWVESKLKSSIPSISIVTHLGLGEACLIVSLGEENVRINDDPMANSIIIRWPETHNPDGLLLQIINIIEFGVSDL